MGVAILIFIIINFKKTPVKLLEKIVTRLKKNEKVNTKLRKIISGGGIIIVISCEANSIQEKQLLIADRETAPTLKVENCSTDETVV